MKEKAPKIENGEAGSKGKVINLRPDGTVDIQFEDGEIFFGVDPSDFRKLPNGEEDEDF